MPPRNPEQVVADALAAFERGDRRAAWDSLRTHARREPGRTEYRLALVETYRAAGHPDQAARWGASVPGVATDHERVLLARIARRASDERALRTSLALPSVPPELIALLPTARDRRRRATERWAGELVPAIGVLGLMSGVGLAVGIVVTLVQAFIGGRAQQFAQFTAWFGLGAVAGVGTLALAACALRRRWVATTVLAVVIVAAVLTLAQSDPTSMTPFG